jgi:hypothetical protein
VDQVHIRFNGNPVQPVPDHGSIFGANGTTYTPPTSSAGTMYYRAMINDNVSGCDDPISQVAQVIVAPDLVVSTQPAAITECVGGTNTMTVAVTGGSGTITYQWQSAPAAGGPWANATGTGATSTTYTPESTVAGTTPLQVLINASNSVVIRP